MRKRLPLLLTLASLLARPLLAAEAPPVPALPDQATLAAAAAKRFPQPVPASTLLHKDVIAPDESQPLLGTVRGIVRGSDGTVRVIINYGGILGIGNRPIAVPLEATALVGQVMEIVGYTQAQLNTLPTWTNTTDAAQVPPDTILKVGLAKPSH